MTSSYGQAVVVDDHDPRRNRSDRIATSESRVPQRSGRLKVQIATVINIDVESSSELLELQDPAASEPRCHEYL
jgi:hypothetical protein